MLLAAPLLVKTECFSTINMINDSGFVCWQVLCLLSSCDSIILLVLLFYYSTYPLCLLFVFIIQYSLHVIFSMGNVPSSQKYRLVIDGMMLLVDFICIMFNQAVTVQDAPVWVLILWHMLIKPVLNSNNRDHKTSLIYNLGIVLANVVSMVMFECSVPVLIASSSILIVATLSISTFLLVAETPKQSDNDDRWNDNVIMLSVDIQTNVITDCHYNTRELFGIERDKPVRFCDIVSDGSIQLKEGYFDNDRKFFQMKLINHQIMYASLSVSKHKNLWCIFVHNMTHLCNKIMELNEIYEQQKGSSEIEPKNAKLLQVITRQ